LTNDGSPDIVVANTSNTLSVLLGNAILGNGNGTFQARKTFTVGNNPTSVAVADLDGDGLLDLVVANRGSNTLGLLRGNGNGTFATQLTFSAGLAPAAVAIGDVNGNGTPDLIFVNHDDNNVTILLGNGNGAFQGAVTLATGTGPIALTILD